MSSQILANWEHFGSADGGPHGLPNRSIEVEVEVSVELRVVASRCSSFQHLPLHRPVTRWLGNESAGAGR